MIRQSKLQMSLEDAAKLLEVGLRGEGIEVKPGGRLKIMADGVTLVFEYEEEVELGKGKKKVSNARSVSTSRQLGGDAAKLDTASAGGRL